MDKNNHTKKLIGQIIQDKRLTAKELQQSESFMESFLDNSEVEDILQKHWKNANSDTDLSPLDFNRIKSKIDNKPSGKKRFLERFAQIAAAVSIPIILAIGWQLTYESKHQANELAISTKQNTTHKTLNQIVLTTENQIFNLSSENIDIIDHNLQIQGSNQTLTLNEHGINQKPKNAKEQKWNTLAIPRGRDYYVELSDGTQVWINAGSKLSFPNFFTSNERHVKLEGEAYFKVKSDKLNPFYVETPFETVCVTGTQFNVCAYRDEPISRITLAEGVVNVKIDDTNHQLSPGYQLQQSQINAQININKVDVDLYTSWRNGVFSFQNMTLEQISYRLSKWYDVEFDFIDRSVLNQRFTGMTKKEYSIEYFLKVIEKTTNVEFTITESDIKVKEL